MVVSYKFDHKARYSNFNNFLRKIQYQITEGIRKQQLVCDIIVSDMFPKLMNTNQYARIHSNEKIKRCSKRMVAFFVAMYELMIYELVTQKNCKKKI